MRVKRIDFQNYKAFSQFTVQLSDFDVLVGPNNAGKSTVIGAFRILFEGIKKANARKPEMVIGPKDIVRGYSLDLRDIPVSLENVFYNYDDKQPAKITFHLDSGNRLTLFFAEKGSCVMIPEATKTIVAPSIFKVHFPITIGFVPVLGPVEHDEVLFQEDAAKRALQTQRTSRNFRNIWYHYKDGFEEFRELIKNTWPGMDIEAPEQIIDDKYNPHLVMMCPEEGWPREIYWAGFGFQVWCQMLTYILKAKGATMLIIDEPDIYLHSDLQRQLVHILQDLGIQLMLATHSIDIISEVEPGSLLTIKKQRKSATRIREPHKLQEIYKVLGTNANPFLTQLAKTRRVVFLEGKDFQLLSHFAHKLNHKKVANRSDFAVVSVEGFNPQKVKDFSHGMETALGLPILKCVIFDRDYRCDEEVEIIKKELNQFCQFVVIHDRKELENFLLVPAVLDKAIEKALQERAIPLNTSMQSEQILSTIAEDLKNDVLSNYIAVRQKYYGNTSPGVDKKSTLSSSLTEFGNSWTSHENKMRMLPGKETLSRFNTALQKEYGISLSQRLIVEAFIKSTMDYEMKSLIQGLATFSSQEPPEANGN